VWARGRRFGQLASERRTEPFALLLEITFADQNRTGMVGFGMNGSQAGDAKDEVVIFIGGVLNYWLAIPIVAALQGMPDPASAVNSSRSSIPGGRKARRVMAGGAR